MGGGMTHLGALHDAVLLHAHAHVHAAAGHGSAQLLPAAACLHRHKGREGGSLLHSSGGKLGGQQGAASRPRCALFGGHQSQVLMLLVDR